MYSSNVLFTTFKKIVFYSAEYTVNTKKLKAFASFID